MINPLAHFPRARLVAAVAALTLLASCGGPSASGTTGGDAVAASQSTGEGAGSSDPTGDGGPAPFAHVQVAEGAYVDADREGGDALSGISFGTAVSAVCTTGERVAVVPEEVDENRVEDWTNATEEPVVYVDPDDVTGDISGLPTCSMAYEQDELDETVLHGDHMHAAHS